jgi:hypothetical protein
VAHTETKGDHVLLGKLTLHPVGPDSVAQGAEVPGVTGRKFSAGAHSSKAGGSRAKAPRTKLRIGWPSIVICATIPRERSFDPFLRRYRFVRDGISVLAVHVRLRPRRRRVRLPLCEQRATTFNRNWGPESPNPPGKPFTI